MRVAIETLGSRGDVQPYLALALALLARGHDVQLAAPVQFQGLVERHRIPYVALPGEFLALLDTPEGKAAIAGGKDFSGGLKLLKHIRPLMMQLFDQEWQAIWSFRPDIIVYHPKSLVSPDMARALGIPHVLASPVPGLTPTNAFPSPLLPFSSLGPFNRLSHVLALKVVGLIFGRDLKTWRARVFGTPADRALAPAGTIYAYSPAVLPKPDDWSSDVLVSGYWFLDEPDWAPDPVLARFLDDGPPPVYFGFGSMPGLHPEAVTNMILQALMMSGKRGVLASGGGAIGTGQTEERALFLAAAPHDRLFPYMHAIVHHGGAGTTAAGLRAGLPTQIIPFFGDQLFWGRKVAELGAGPPPLERAKLSAKTLAKALAALDDPVMRARARALSDAIRLDPGVEAAVDFLETRVAFAQ
ncbi:glycosyltransferase [Rhizobium rhizophilum]|uniref:Glycosyltransferase family 1 protein n=1 Tax=Rhizobium rhizophilum TaxID=1850373 RepID=A0ABY2QS20_9HYPH|nr:glycosyltransferase [Rhizobium rhizophilum]THV12440.1 glycosyltransferase family 1 protein [Rhizobium rhizophilum]